VKNGNLFHEFFDKHVWDGLSHSKKRLRQVEKLEILPQKGKGIRLNCEKVILYTYLYLECDANGLTKPRECDGSNNIQRRRNDLNQEMIIDSIKQIQIRSIGRGG
jgi:hypothetical protein